jgi:F-type H+-transporting ATPase subunit a
MPFSTILASALTLNAPAIFQSGKGEPFSEWLSNSIFVSAFVATFIIWFARKATKNMSVVPGPTQNFFEAVVQGLYDLVESIVGTHMVARVFSLLATLFIFIIVSNWFALLPGVGSIGWGHETPEGFHLTAPLLRPTTADMNMTLAMSAVFMIFWLYWSISEVGIKGFLGHIFGVKEGLTGFMALALIPIFLFVGIIEVVSMAFRPMSLSLRLFGNVFAGEHSPFHHDHPRQRSKASCSDRLHSLGHDPNSFLLPRNSGGSAASHRFHASLLRLHPALDLS